MATRAVKTRTTPARRLNLSEAEWELRVKLAACYRMFARREMDDLIYTHLSVRLTDQPDAYLFIGFGQLFDDVTASNLLKVDIDGKNIGGTPGELNPAGWVVHGTVYKAQPKANSVMHLHTIPGVAVSAQKCGLLPVNQFAITYAGSIGYHDYDGPGLRPEEQKTFVLDLGDNRMMFLRNHGTLTWGRTLAEAFTLMHYLERTCEIQIAAQAGGELAVPPRAVIERTVKTGQGTGDARWGEIGFEALIRRLDREDTSYRD
jgi:ribulose-5-phosphate 4-epimerase/fuculose-1-phosphate aldolase